MHKQCVNVHVFGFHSFIYLFTHSLILFIYVSVTYGNILLTFLAAACVSSMDNRKHFYSITHQFLFKTSSEKSLLISPSV